MVKNKRLSPGFIGIGLMGKPMVLRLLLAGFEVRVWNRSSEKLADVVSAGAVVSDSPAQLAASTDIIMLCLANTGVVESIAGDAAFIDALDDGKIIVDLSSISPDATRRLAERIHAESGAAWIDAPVSGGVAGAEQGSLVVMAGGDEADLARVKPLLAPLSSRVTHMGPVGAGQTAKLCNQVIVGCNISAIAEAIRLAREAGVDAASLPDALAGGFADSLPFQIFGRRMAEGNELPVSIKMETMLKDLDGALTTGGQLGLDLPLTRSAAELLRVREQCGDGERCISALVNPPPTEPG
jgi:3-hydroxyisobutyrate dehydrogenase